MSHSIHMMNCKIVAVGLLTKKVSLNKIKAILRGAFKPVLPENAITKALALARFGSEENYKNVKRFRRGISNRNAISKSEGGLP